MLRDITLGQYYPADSVVHKLDPRVKLFATMIYIIALFTFRGILGFAIITGMLIFMIKISKVPFSYIVKGLKAIVVLLLITAVFNLVFTPTGTEYWHCTVSSDQYRYYECGAYDDPADLSDHWNVSHDTDHDAKPADRWT